MTEPYIDARQKDYLEYLDRCADCKEEFAVRLHLRHECSSCTMKELDAMRATPVFGFHWKKMWEHFNKAMDGVFGK